MRYNLQSTVSDGISATYGGTSASGSTSSGSGMGWTSYIPWDTLGQISGNLIGNWMGTNDTSTPTGSNTGGLTAAQIAAQIAAGIWAGTNPNTVPPAPLPTEKDNTILYVGLGAVAILGAAFLLKSKPVTRRRYAR